jgi:hypothetical protein
MPKQLKVIIDDNYTPLAPTTVNFSAPVVIEPGNRIALDKFTAVINSITSNFNLPDSTFTFYYSLASDNFQSADVFIPAANYEFINDLMIAITAACNNTFTAYKTGYLPSTFPLTTDRDVGLKILCDTTTSLALATTNTFRMQYCTVADADLVLDQVGMTVGIGGFWYSNATGVWSVTQNNAGFLLQGGGCSCEFRVNFATAVDAIANQSLIYIGLIASSTDGLYHGLLQNKLGEIYLVNGNQTTQVDIANFPESVVGGAQYYCQIYQVAGQFALRYYRLNNNGTQTEIYNSNTLNPGALGAIDYTVNYIFQSDGVNGPIVNQNQAPGIYQNGNMTFDAVPPTSSGTFLRTVAFDMSKSGALRAGLDVPPGLNVLGPQNSLFGSFTCQSSINMSILNSAFDIAIEILDLPLQTYQAVSGGMPGQRNNVVAYFHPALSQIGTSTYIYDSRAYQWLDIDVSYPINLSSLSFRIYNPATGLGIDALSISFNLLIGETEY